MKRKAAALDRSPSPSGNPSKLIRYTKGSEGQSGESSETLESGDGLPRYTYQPLNEDHIRVLVLEPGTFGTPLHGELFPARTDSEVVSDDHDGYDDHNDYFDYDAYYNQDAHAQWLRKYEAISYAWGPSEFSNHITLGGGSVLKITLSLYQALQRFRFDDRQRTLWADAICINQNDNLEKSSQVRKMGQIYKQARPTLVWLGESNCLDWLAFGVFAVMGGREIEEDSGNLSVEALGGALFNLRQSCLCCPAVPIDSASTAIKLAAQALKTLVSRPWFMRLWVVQEYTLSRMVSLHCGSHIARREDLLRLCEWHNSHRKCSPFELGSTLDDISSTIFDLWMNVNSFLGLLRSTAANVCADARDRVFAIKEMCKARNWSETVPNYDIEPNVLFARVVCKCLIHGNEDELDPEYHPAVLLAIAPAAKALHEGLDGLPSWSPDLQRLDHRFSGFTWQRYKLWVFPWTATAVAASKGRVPLELRVYGVMCGQVMHTLHDSQVELVGRVGCEGANYFSEMTIFPDTEKLEDWLRHCGQFVLKFHGTHRDEDPRDTAFHALEGPQTPPGHVLVALEAAGRRQLSENELKHVKNLFNQRLATHIGPGRLFAVIQTDTGSQFGWVPAGTQAADEVCFFKGCLWPFVLRRLPDSDAYQIIGDACFPHLIQSRERVIKGEVYLDLEGVYDFEYGKQNVVYIR